MCKHHFVKLSSLIAHFTTCKRSVKALSIVERLKKQCRAELSAQQDAKRHIVGNNDGRTIDRIRETRSIDSQSGRWKIPKDGKLHHKISESAGTVQQCPKIPQGETATQKLLQTSIKPADQVIRLQPNHLQIILERLNKGEIMFLTMPVDLRWAPFLSISHETGTAIARTITASEHPYCDSALFT